MPEAQGNPSSPSHSDAPQTHGYGKQRDSLIIAGVLRAEFGQILNRMQLWTSKDTRNDNRYDFDVRGMIV